MGPDVEDYGHGWHNKTQTQFDNVIPFKGGQHDSPDTIKKLLQQELQKIISDDVTVTWVSHGKQAGGIELRVVYNYN